MKSLVLVSVLFLIGCSMPFEKVSRDYRPERIELPAKVEFVGPPNGKPVLAMDLPPGVYEFVGEDSDAWLYLHRDGALGGRTPIPGFMNRLQPHRWPAGIALFKRYDGYCAAFLVSESDAREMAGEIGAAVMPKREGKRIFRDIYPLPAAEVRAFIHHGEKLIGQNGPNQALQPTRMLVTFRADARPAPSTRVADL